MPGYFFTKYSIQTLCKILFIYLFIFLNFFTKYFLGKRHWDLQLWRTSVYWLASIHEL